MRGQFKGWIPGKAFGFIVPEDGSDDIFVHQSRAANPDLFIPGSVVEFEAEDTEKGPAVIELQLISTGAPPEPHPDYPHSRTGRVKFWSDRGYGFIVPSDGDADVFVHANQVPDAGRYLSEGDVVEFATAVGDKGPEAYQLSVVDWQPPIDHLARFADMGPPGWLEALKALAEIEPWEYKKTSSSEPLPILRSYVRHTFRRLEELDEGIAVTTAGDAAAFNTGLVTPNQEEIFALFRPNPRPNRQPWRLVGFRKASDWEFVNSFGASPPPLAMYFDDPSVLLYDRRCELYINIDHVMEHLARFPGDLQNNEFVARQLLMSAEANTKKRVYRNYKTAIPQFYRERGGGGSVQLLLPMCLQNPAEADLALVVARSATGDAYRGSTVLTLDMAYNNARLLARPDTEWLQP